MLWLDMFTRCIGWDAVFHAELAKGASIEEARQRAQLATVNTQNSASPKDLPAYMATNDEFLNLLILFQNQGAKIWGAVTHDLYGDIKTGRVNEAFAGFIGVILSSFLVACLNNGDLPESAEEAAKMTAKETLANVPIVGSMIVSTMDGFSGGSVLDTAVQDAVKGFGHIGKGNADEAALAIYSAYSLLWAGVPVTVVKRAYRAAKNGNPAELIGLRSKQKRKRELVVP